MKSLHMATYTLMAVGALNWGLVGLLKYNLVESIFGFWPSLLMLVYVLIGASAVYEFATHMSGCKLCGKK
ncbi:DUF378 domain-containing protein [Candidatus Gottesmanbacteria bacterium]|nr:DUF378 domain-containing protein [Candidatus Gottesmanbacteria bacterium]